VLTTAQVGESLSELVRDERIEQRVEAAVDVERERREWRNIYIHVRVAGRYLPFLALNPHVMRQHAQRERDDDDGKQTHHLASRRQKIQLR